MSIIGQIAVNVNIALDKISFWQQNRFVPVEDKD